MKKTIPILLLLSVIIALSCSKKSCYTCVKGYNLKMAGKDAITRKDTVTECGMTPKQKADYEKDNSYSNIEPGQGSEVQTTVCY